MQYPVMEHFYTLQGEGAYTGHAAYFIRLAGCDVACHWCDVKQSWDKNIHPNINTNDLIIEAMRHEARIAVVTGGEPLMHDCAPLTHALHEKGFKSHIETSGAYPLSGSWDWVCFSPKKFKAPLFEFYQLANELKIIVYNTSDFAFAEEQRQKINNKDMVLYLQPEWGARHKVMPMIVDYVKANPIWKVSLQTHKYLDIP
ncbi:MAG: 7-carboxy-7-deazaguanine synthase QueE [Cytophagales bacterium]|nr:7-carboxy-7-deazaguanine synthase QueE [Cytophagales bacterium]